MRHFTIFSEIDEVLVRIGLNFAYRIYKNIRLCVCVYMYIDRVMHLVEAIHHIYKNHKALLLPSRECLAQQKTFSFLLMF